MGYLRKECSTCGYWKKIGQHCGAIMHGMKCIAGPLTVEPGAAVPLPEGEKGQARMAAYEARMHSGPDGNRFLLWSHRALADFAKDVLAQNKRLREQLAQIRELANDA